MRTIDRIRVHAPYPRAFAAASAVARWPSILPHSRWVRLLDGGCGDGRLASLRQRPHQVSDVVGLGDDGRSARGRDSVYARPGYHPRHAGGVEAGRGWWRCWRYRRRGDRAHLDRTTLAAHRPARRRSGDRPDFHPWDRVTHARRHQARRREKGSAVKTFRRVVITGVGAVTPIGTSAAGLWAGLEARASAVRTITRF